MPVFRRRSGTGRSGHEPQVGRSRRPHPAARRHLQAASGADLGHQVTWPTPSRPILPARGAEVGRQQDLSQTFGITLSSRIIAESGLNNLANMAWVLSRNHHARRLAGCLSNPITFDVEELLAERGLDVSYETVRRWALKFGPAYARNLRRMRPRPSAQWHLDEMAVVIGGKRLWLWRAVDCEGEILDMLVQPRRDQAAALRLMRKLLRKTGLCSDGARELLPLSCGARSCARRLGAAAGFAEVGVG